MDEKWTMIQEAILSISEGRYDLQLPENLGDDHLDSILVALKMMGETLEDREKMLKALGAYESLDQAVVMLDMNLNILSFNAIAQSLFQNGLKRGKPFEQLLANEPLQQYLQELGIGMSSQELLELHLADGHRYEVRATLINPYEPIDFEGAILQFKQLS